MSRSRRRERRAVWGRLARPCGARIGGQHSPSGSTGGAPIGEAMRAVDPIAYGTLRGGQTQRFAHWFFGGSGFLGAHVVRCRRPGRPRCRLGQPRSGSPPREPAV